MNCFRDHAKLSPGETIPHESSRGLAHLVCASLSQQRAPLDIRALAADGTIDWSCMLRQHLAPTTGTFVLSTCNRFEIYLYDSALPPVDLWRGLETLLVRTFQASGDASAQEIDAQKRPPLMDYFDIHTGTSAARHLCQVSAGMESKVFGESEILGQISRAYDAHVASHLLGIELDAVVRSALRTGKRVRHETRIGANAGSIGSLALQTVEERHRSCRGAIVAVIGAGEMGRLVARAAAARGAGCVLVLNRTQSRAVELADELHASGWCAEAVAWDALDSAVSRADIVFCATASPVPILTRTRMAPLMLAQHKVLVDLAVPRDIAPDVAELAGIDVLDLDALHSDLDHSLAERHAAVPQAQSIIAEELDRLADHLRELTCRPLIVDLRQKAERIRQQELERTLKFIGEVDPEVAKHVEHLTRALVNKLLHDPTVWIRETAISAPEDVPTELVRNLFALESAAPEVTNGVRPEVNAEGQQDWNCDASLNSAEPTKSVADRAVSPAPREPSSTRPVASGRKYAARIGPLAHLSM